MPTVLAEDQQALRLAALPSGRGARLPESAAELNYSLLEEKCFNYLLKTISPNHSLNLFYVVLSALTVF